MSGGLSQKENDHATLRLESQLMPSDLGTRANQWLSQQPHSFAEPTRMDLNLAWLATPGRRTALALG